MENLSNLNIANWEKSDAYVELQNLILELDKFSKSLEDISTSKNNFITSFPQLPEYLNSLTLLQESSLFHIIILLLVLLTVFNIVSIFFANEIIKYYKLETRFPRLGLFFRLRSKFQRYYLIWSLFILFIVCISSICIDILLFTIK